MDLLSKYTLDVFQLNLPASLSVSAHLKQYAPGSKNFKKNCIPVIYGEDIQHTIGISRFAYKHILAPEHFGCAAAELKWFYRNDRYEVPSEQMELQVFVKPPLLKFKIIPQKEDREQYHIEFSSAKDLLFPDALATLRLKYIDFKDLMFKLKCYVRSEAMSKVDFSKENTVKTKEELRYTIIPVSRYSFDLSEFKYLTQFLEQKRIKIDPAFLCYDSLSGKDALAGAPVMKFGRNLRSSLTGDTLCRAETFFVISQGELKKYKEARIKGQETAKTDTPAENSFEIEIESFLNAVYTYNEEFGPIYLWSKSLD